MLLASRQIWDSFEQHYAEISSHRPYWSPEYMVKISKLIDKTTADFEYENGQPTPPTIAAMNHIHYVVNGLCNICLEIFEEKPLVKNQFLINAIIQQYN